MPEIMTNVQRQASLEKQYGLQGNCFYCEFCEFCKDKTLIGNSSELIDRNCSFIEGKTPCATAYNRMVRKYGSGGGLLWQSQSVGMRKLARRKK